MAEVVGTFASAAGLASLALDITKSIKKLKDFYDSVKSVPKDLAHLIAQLENLDLQIQDMSGKTPLYQELLMTTASLKVAVSRCKDCVADALLVATQLQAAVTKNKTMGSIRTVLNRDNLRRLNERLEQATLFLILACTCGGL